MDPAHPRDGDPTLDRQQWTPDEWAAIEKAERWQMVGVIAAWFAIAAIVAGAVLFVLFVGTG